MSRQDFSWADRRGWAVYYRSSSECWTCVNQQSSLVVKLSELSMLAVSCDKNESVLFNHFAAVLHTCKWNVFSRDIVSAVVHTVHADKVQFSWGRHCPCELRAFAEVSTFRDLLYMRQNIVFNLWSVLTVLCTHMQVYDWSHALQTSGCHWRYLFNYLFFIYYYCHHNDAFLYS